MSQKSTDRSITIHNPAFLSHDKAREIREKFGSPVFVYDMETLLRKACEALEFPNAFGLTVRYAMKACPAGAIIHLLNKAGIHIDASSGYEVERAIKAGVPPEQIQLTGQELPPDLKSLVEQGVLFNACSPHQLEAYGRLFPGKEISIRMNPGLGSGHSKKTNVGGPSSSFGIWHGYLEEMKSLAREFGLKIVRLHSHIGSGSDPEVWQRCAKMTLDIAARLEEVHTVNLGGGFKVARVAEEKATDLELVGQPIADEFHRFAEEHGRELKLEIEPGTYIVANAGAVVASVEDMTDTGEGGYHFIKLNAGMTEVTRTCLYGSQHLISVVPAVNEPREVREYIVVGHCCESGDILTPAPGDPEELGPRHLLEAKIGDIVVIDGSGAYCSGMSTKNYNSFPEAAEVLLAPDGSVHLIRRRQTLDQIIENEEMPPLPDMAKFGRALGTQLGF